MMKPCQQKAPKPPISVRCAALNRITQDIREYVKDKGMPLDSAMEEGLNEKAKEFKEVKYISKLSDFF
jgi:hypothetical protein